MLISQVVSSLVYRVTFMQSYSHSRCDCAAVDFSNKENHNRADRLHDVMSEVEINGSDKDGI